MLHVLVARLGADDGMDRVVGDRRYGKCARGLAVGSDRRARVLSVIKIAIFPAKAGYVSCEAGNRFERRWLAMDGAGTKARKGNFGCDNQTTAP